MIAFLFGIKVHRSRSYFRLTSWIIDDLALVFHIIFVIRLQEDEEVCLVLHLSQRELQQHKKKNVENSYDDSSVELGNVLMMKMRRQMTISLNSLLGIADSTDNLEMNLFSIDNNLKEGKI